MERRCGWNAGCKKMQDAWNAERRPPTAAHMQACPRTNGISCEHRRQGARQTGQSRRETPAAWDWLLPSHWCRLTSSGRRHHCSHLRARVYRSLLRGGHQAIGAVRCFSVLLNRQNSVRRGRDPRKKAKIGQALRSGSFEFGFCQKKPGSSRSAKKSIRASHSTFQVRST